MQCYCYINSYDLNICLHIIFNTYIHFYYYYRLEDEWITCDKKTNFNVIERVVPIMSMSTENRDSITKLFGNIFPPLSRRSRK